MGGVVVPDILVTCPVSVGVELYEVGCNWIVALYIKRGESLFR